MCFLISIQVLQYVFHVMPFEILCHHLWQNHLLNHKKTENATPFLTWYKVILFSESTYPYNDREPRQS